MEQPELVDECLRELFRNSYTVHVLTTRLHGQSDVLREISMNAAIAAGHAGSQSRVFSEIAKQIGIASQMLAQSMERFRGQTGQMSNNTLASIIESSRKDKFTEALENISGPNRAAIIQIANKYDLSIYNLLAETQFNLARMLPEYEQLKQITNRVWSTAMNLRVSAGAAEQGEDLFFLSIAESLEAMANETNDLTNSLMNTMIRIDEILSSRCGCKGGDLYAA